MTKPMMWLGFAATLVIVGVLGLVTFREPVRQAEAQTALHEEAITTATDLYAQNCTVCHGATGEGIGATPALATDGIRGMDYASLYDVIARGRYNTAMPGWSVENGGVLQQAEIEQMIVLMQQGDWSAVGTRVAELGLTPPTAEIIEVPEEVLVQLETMPGGDALSAGLTLYAENCAACHGADLGGTTLAPALTTPELLAQADDAISRTITAGVPGTLMAGWGGKLTGEQVADLISLIRGWSDVQSAGVELPVVEVPTIPATAEMIAEGQQLYSVACTACHGSTGLGTAMAPALNSQTFLAETPDAAIYQIIAGGVPGTRMPAWGGRLSDADLNAIVAYLRSLETTAPLVSEPAQTTPAGGGGPPWMNNP